jgi:HK97 family phage major capsid protein
MKGLNRETLLNQARAIVEKEPFTREDAARSNGLMSLAERIGKRWTRKEEGREFRTWLRHPDVETKIVAERRAMGIGLGTSGGYLVPVGFRRELMVALRLYDKLFDPSVVDLFKSDNGLQIPVPVIDDTGSAAVAIDENMQAEEQDPVLSQVLLPLAPMWRSGIVKVSHQLLQDSAFDPLDFLAAAFAVRFARGIGPSLVASLLSSAKLGKVADGSASNTGGSETGINSIGTQDLIALRSSVNPAYRASGKVYWLMNDNTLGALLALLDKQGRPIFHVDRWANDEDALLYGYPIAICPSMDDIGSGKKPIAFGATGFFVTRIVKNEIAIANYSERWAEYGQVGFQGMVRCNGDLACIAGADAPVKYLQNAEEQ